MLLFLSGLCAFLLHPCPIFSLFLVNFLLYFLAFVVWKLLPKYLEIACLHLDWKFLGSAILFTTSVLTQSSAECQRQQCQAWLILSKHPKIHLFPKPLFWWGESINNKALQAHRCDFAACVTLLSMQGGYILTGIQMTFPEKQTISMESASRSRSLLLLEQLRMGRSSPSLELHAETVTPWAAWEQRLESQLRGTRLGHPTHTEHSSARAVCGRGCT